MTSTARKQRPPTVTEPVRVMVVVGAASRRAEICGWLDREPDLAVVAACHGAGRAAGDIDRVGADLIVVDPETAAGDFGELAELSVIRPGLPILMVRADGSPGAPVSRFGVWERPGETVTRSSRAGTAAALVAAIRALELPTTSLAVARGPIHRHPVAGLA